MQSAHDMTPQQLLVALGDALHGPAWRRPVARELGVSHTTVERIAEGGTMTNQVRLRLRLWCEREFAAEVARMARRVELLSLGRAMPFRDPTTEEDT